MSASIRAPGLALTLFLLVAAWRVAPAAPPDEDARSRAERILLDPETDERAFYRAAQNLTVLPGGHTALIKGVDFYGKQRNADRQAYCLRSLAVAVGNRADLVPDRLIPGYVRLLETARTPYPPVIRLMGALGRRGRPALPVLKSIRDGSDISLGFLAAQAIQQIERSKEK